MTKKRIIFKGMLKCSHIHKIKQVISFYFVFFEVLTVYIPNFVEKDQFEKIAKMLVDLDENIPFHILAFFPEYKLMDYRAPTLNEILDTYLTVKKIGLNKVKIGNLGVFIKNEAEMNKFLEIAGPDAI